jgi:hypothetical protein
MPHYCLDFYSRWVGTPGDALFLGQFNIELMELTPLPLDLRLSVRSCKTDATQSNLKRFWLDREFWLR